MLACPHLSGFPSGSQSPSQEQQFWWAGRWDRLLYLYQHFRISIPSTVAKSQMSWGSPSSFPWILVHKWDWQSLWSNLQILSSVLAFLRDAIHPARIADLLFSFVFLQVFGKFHFSYWCRSMAETFWAAISNSSYFGIFDRHDFLDQMEPRIATSSKEANRGGASAQLYPRAASDFVLLTDHQPCPLANLRLPIHQYLADYFRSAILSLWPESRLWASLGHLLCREDFLSSWLGYSWMIAFWIASANYRSKSGLRVARIRWGSLESWSSPRSDGSWPFQCIEFARVESDMGWQLAGFLPFVPWGGEEPRRKPYRPKIEYLMQRESISLRWTYLMPRYH